MTSKSRPPSMIDVAKLAGVSPQTVSRVLNDPDKVARSTLEKVEEVIQQVGYRRNLSARALKRSKSDIIGVIRSNTNSFGPTSVVTAFESAARQQGWATQLGVIEGTTAEAARATVDHLLDYGVDGLAIISSEKWVAAGVRKAKVDVPIVAVEAGARARGNISIVSVDQYAGAWEVMEHLKSLGYSKIDHLAGPHDWPDGRERARAWRDFLEENNDISGNLTEGDWSPLEGYRYGMEYQVSEPSAVFVSNDNMAIGVLRAFWERGVSVPDQVAIAGVDDLDQAPFLTPSLTSVRQPFEQVGHAIVDALRQRINGGSPSTVLVAPKLVQRESTLGIGKGDIPNSRI